VRPIFLRLAERTRAHAFVVMLAYQIIQYLALCWSPFDCTVEEGLRALTTLCLVEVAPKNAPSGAWQKYSITLRCQWATCVRPLKRFGHRAIEIVDEGQDALPQILNRDEVASFQ